MNILPKKRWHVRTKDNIARVRRDEAEAAEIEKERIRRAKLGEQEARTSYLRSKAHGNDGKSFKYKGAQPKASDAHSSSSKKNEADIYTTDGNINFFKDIEAGKQADATNKEHEAEKKAEQEKYEKSIGYLTYLGQNSLEATGDKAWYEQESVTKLNLNLSEEFVEVGLKSKSKLDPINDIIKYTGFKPKKVTLNTKPNVNDNHVEAKKIEDKLIQVVEKQRIEHDSKRLKESQQHKRKHKREHKKGKRKSKNERKHKKETREDSRCRNCKRKLKRSNSDSDDNYHHKKRRRQSYGSSGTEDSESSSMSSDESSDESYQREKQKKLDVLRAERLKREAEERRRAERLLAGKKADGVETPAVNKANFQQKYNSQFNPHIARQNQEPKTLETGVKYWLQ